ncbi:exodeoxyribonuclease VII large subunit [Gammaproteobacteria bacterium]|nr:exodeoxyribonuclease VII large subunit [Gammaproteobacteria bacterium]
MKIYSVYELNTQARDAMLFAFQYPITVKGEISDYRTSRGHQYFKLRDNSSSHSVSCVVWKGSSSSLNLSEYLHMEVIVTAKVDFYAGFGQFQLNIIELSEFSDGFIKKEIERLKKKLSDEGIFDDKKNLPVYPQSIGILTAHDSHALKDVCSKLNEKYPLSKLYIYPSTVQGELAPRTLIRQLKRINEDNIVDVVLIVRGGGSLQDLMAFNNEDLVRAISASEIPIITGIGHKPDITLADYAADSAQETPTAAAIKSVPDCEVLKQDINYIEITLTTLSNNIISLLQNKLKSYLTILKIGRPIKVISNIANEFIQKRILLNKAINNKIRIYIEVIQNNKDRQRRFNKKVIADLYEHGINICNTQKLIKRALKSNLIAQTEILNLKMQQIKQINPDLLLRKGYAIVRNNNNKIIKSIDDTTSQSDLEIQVYDGLIKVKIKE